MRYVGLTLAIAVLLAACGACGGKLITADCGPSGHLCLTEIQGLWCCPTSAECGLTSKTCIEQGTPDEPNGDGGSPNETSTPSTPDASSTGNSGCNGIGCGGAGTGGAQGPGSGQGRM